MTGLLVLWHLKPKTPLGSACSNNQSWTVRWCWLLPLALSLLRLGVTSNAAATAWELLDLPCQRHQGGAEWKQNRQVCYGSSWSWSVYRTDSREGLVFTNLSEITIIGIFGIIARNTCGRPNFVWKVLSQTCECVPYFFLSIPFQPFELLCFCPCLAASSSRCRSFWTFSWRACACSTCHCLQQLVRSVQWKKPLGMSRRSPSWFSKLLCCLHLHFSFVSLSALPGVLIVQFLLRLLQ